MNDAGRTQSPSPSDLASYQGVCVRERATKGLDYETEGPSLHCICSYPGDTGHDVATVGLGILERGHSWVC